VVNVLLISVGCVALVPFAAAFIFLLISILRDPQTRWAFVVSVVLALLTLGGVFALKAGLS
jgi:uncharacterized membrane protein YqjE